MQKVENDAEAFLRSYVTKRDRNADAAKAAVQSSHSYTAEEALNQHLIDLIANNDAELLAALDGRTITRMDGTKQTLHLAARGLTCCSPRCASVLGWLVNPNIALLLLVGGALLIYLEFNAPGTIVPGALGTLMVLLAIFALNLLPIRYTAVLLLVAALVLLLLEAKFGGHGALAIAGIVCLTFGMLTLVAAPVPEMADQPAGGDRGERGVWRDHRVSGAAGGARAKHEGALGADALVGSGAATAMEPLTPQGHVLVEGEIWQAVASEPVAKGTALRVVGMSSMLLRVDGGASQ
jgi:membrane-bound serine protease (ClpP class)